MVILDYLVVFIVPKQSEEKDIAEQMMQCNSIIQYLRHCYFDRTVMTKKAFPLKISSI